MKIILCVLVCLFASCVVPVETTTDEQAVCNPRNDDCVGGHLTLSEAKQQAIDYAAWKEQQAGLAQPAPSTSCTSTGSTISCWSHDWINGAQWVDTSCSFCGNGTCANCSSTKCTVAGNPEGKVCTPL